ncbi:unnamed protein product, partial [Nesidiocoris tenuis]
MQYWDIIYVHRDVIFSTSYLKTDHVQKRWLDDRLMVAVQEFFHAPPEECQPLVGFNDRNVFRLLAIHSFFELVLEKNMRVQKIFFQFSGSR